jgi:hypothetical protein
MTEAPDNVYRIIADGLIYHAEMLPREHPAVMHLRDAAAAILDADAKLNPDKLPKAA